MGFFHVFPPRRVSPPTSCPKNRKHILFNFVFWNPLWASKTTFSLKEIVGDWSILGAGLFYWPSVFSLFLFAGFYFIQISCPQMHEMNTSCTKLPPILCHCCLLYLLAYYAMWANSSKSSQPHENDWKWRSCSKQVLGICLLGVHGNVTILMLALGKSVKQTINFHRWCGFSMFFLPAECRPPPVTQKTGKHI